MALSKSDEIRIKILKTIHNLEKEKPDILIEPDELQNQVEGIPAKEYEYHLDRLIEDGFMNRPALGAIEITSKGKKAVEEILDGHSILNRVTSPIQVNIIVEKFLLNIKKEIERADLPEEQRKTLLDEVNEFLSNPVISPFVGSALLKLFG